MRLLRLIVTCASVAAAQRVRPVSRVIEQDPIIGVRQVRTAGSLYTDSLVKRRCPPVVLAEPTPPDAERPTRFTRTWCGADTAYALPDADGARWLGAVYSRHEVHESDSTRRALLNSPYDTVTTVTAVLYRAGDRPGTWSPEWLGTVARSMVRAIDIVTVSRPDKSMLAAVGYCVNGTGGCWQHFLRRRSGRWTAVVEAFWKQLPAIPDGSLGKGPGIDVAKLTGTYGVYSRGDGNCCPSRELLLELDQRGDSLVLRKHDLRRVRPY